MELLYIREQDFHLASEEEQDDILSHYEKKNRKIWFKRFIITLILATIGIVFQIIAAYISPWLYPSTGYYRTVVLCGMLLFLGVNVLSWGILKLEQNLEFNPEKTPVLKLRVKSKLFVQNLTIMRQKKWFITCETDEVLIEDAIIVNNKPDFNSIKEGDMVYVKRRGEDGNFLYYYIA